VSCVSRTSSDRESRAAPWRRAERDHWRDRGGEDGAGALARPADGREKRGRQIVRPEGRRPGSRACSICPRICWKSLSWRRSPGGCQKGPTRSCWAAGSRRAGGQAPLSPARAASASELKLLGGRATWPSTASTSTAKLTISSAQMEVLDGFAGAGHLKARRLYRIAHRECGRLAAELAELRERDGSRARPRHPPL